MMRKTKNTALYDEAKTFVEFAISGLLPVVAYADKALEIYENRPCVHTGSARQEAEALAMKSIIQTRKLLWKAWKENFKEVVSAEEYSDMMEETLKKLRPEGEETKSQGKVWLGKVGKELDAERK